MKPKKNIHSGNVMTGFIKLALGRVRLLLPDTEMLSIESVTNVRLPDTPDCTYGFISINNTDIPVYAFNDDLRQQALKKSGQQVCVCLSNARNQIGILCDDATMVNSGDIKLHELPACMNYDDTPIRNIAASNSNLFCVSNTASLARLIIDPAPSLPASDS